MTVDVKGWLAHDLFLRLENEGGIGPAKTKGVGKDGVEGGLARFTDEVELAGGIGFADVEAGGEDVVFEGEEADRGFDGSGSTEEVAHGGLGGGN